MADTLEADIENECIRYVETLGGLALKLQIFGIRGFMDRTILLPGGRVVFVEFKRPKKGIHAAQQAQWAKLLRSLGFRVYLVDSFDKFMAAVDNA